MPDQYDHSPPPLGYGGIESAALRRYITGACTPEERRRVEGWASESPERERYLAALSALYARAPEADVRSAAAAWPRVSAKLSRPPEEDDVPFYRAPWERTPEFVEVRPRRRARVLSGAFGTQRRGGWPLAVAMAASVVFAIGGIKATVETVLARRHPPIQQPSVMRQIMTAKGQRAEIQLDDGSRVVLGVASRLRLSSDFGTRTREVYLDGTAYFDVVHDATHPFIVHTVNAIARDVGTRFVVRAYPESHDTRVIVRDGTVALRSAGDKAERAPEEVLLTGGHLGQLRAGETTVTTRRVDPALYTAWMQGDLVFRDVPLSEAVAELKRWFAVDVVVGDPSLRDMPISASFAVESFDEALSVMTTVLPLRASRRGNVVTLYRR